MSESQIINHTVNIPKLLNPEYKKSLLSSPIEFASLRFHSPLGIYDIMRNLTDKNEITSHLQASMLFVIIHAIFKNQWINKVRATRDHFISEKELVKYAKTCGIRIDGLFNKAKKELLTSDYITSIHDVDGTKYYEVAPLTSFGNMIFEFKNITNSFNFQVFKTESVRCVAGKPLKTVKGHYGLLGEEYLAKLFGMSQPAIHNILKPLNKIYCYAEVSNEYLSALKQQGKQMLIDDNKLFLGSKTIYDANYRIRMKNGITRPVRYLSASNKNHLNVYTPGDKLESVIYLEKTTYFRLHEDANQVRNNRVYQVISNSREEAIKKLKIIAMQSELALKVKSVIDYIEKESDFKFHFNIIDVSTLSKLQQVCGREIAKILRNKNIPRKNKNEPGLIAMWSKTADFIIGRQNVAKEMSLAQIVLAS